MALKHSRRKIKWHFAFLLMAPFIFGWNSSAATFAECRRILQETSDRKPFVLTSEPFFNNAEQDEFQMLFDLYQQNQIPRSDSGEVLRFLNPFQVEATYNPSTKQLTRISSKLNTDDAFAYRMLKKMFKAALKQAHSNPLLNSHLDPTQN